MNMINQNFENLQQRAIYYFLATYPSFIPLNSSLATEEEQKSTHIFIHKIYEKLYNDSSLLGIKIIPFDYIHLQESIFKHCFFNNVKLEGCDLIGFTIDGINVQDALNAYKDDNKRRINKMAELKNFEIKQFGSYKFIGKSVYARAGGMCNTTGQSNIFGGLWNNSNWIFEKLDELKDFATDEIHNAALLTWDKYDDKSKLLGYTVGRFMKANTPVPDGMDYFDIPDTFVAKRWFDKEEGGIEGLVKNAVEQQGEYTVASWKFTAEIEAKDAFGYYIACDKK